MLSIGISYNRPKLCPDAAWSFNGTTILRNASIGYLPQNVFVDGINTLYVTSRTRPTVHVWPQSSISITNNITLNANLSMSLFVHMNGDIFVDNGFLNKRVDRWNFNTSTITAVMYVNGSCHGLFISTNDELYCSMGDFHQIVKKSLSDINNSTIVVAGIGVAGSTSSMLNSPQGIYLDANINLYVADCGNDRVQLFQSMQTTAITVLGNGSSQTIALRCPTSIVLDSDGYLFVVDQMNHRIIGSGPYGFRCIIGCSGSGSSMSTLLNPQTMAFDSYGNILVADSSNNRIQKFTLQTTACGKPSVTEKSYKCSHYSMVFHFLLSI